MTTATLMLLLGLAMNFTTPDSKVEKNLLVVDKSHALVAIVLKQEIIYPTTEEGEHEELVVDISVNILGVIDTPIEYPTGFT